MSEDENEIEVLFLGPMYGWLCAMCGQVRVGYPTPEGAKSNAEQHAMVKHTSGFPEGKTSMTLHVEWSGPEEDGNG